MQILSCLSFVCLDRHCLCGFWSMVGVLASSDRGVKYLREFNWPWASRWRVYRERCPPSPPPTHSGFVSASKVQRLYHGSVYGCWRTLVTGAKSTIVTQEANRKWYDRLCYLSSFPHHPVNIIILEPESQGYRLQHLFWRAAADAGHGGQHSFICIANGSSMASSLHIVCRSRKPVTGRQGCPGQF